MVSSGRSKTKTQKKGEALLNTSTMSSKRRRVDPVFRVRRPIDKDIISVALGTIDATQSSLTLTTAVFPCTVTGLRWNFSTNQDGGTGLMAGFWAIVFLAEGQVLDTLTTTNGSSFYQPEQDVLTYGVSSIENNSETKEHEGTTKTMRKLKVGDRLVLVALGVATQTHTLRGMVQFFCKT